MTDARMPGHWLYQPQLDGLSDRAWRTFVGSLMWSADQGTDGQLPDHALRFLYPSGVDDATSEELVNSQRWRRTPSGYLVANWEKTQSLAADVEKQRQRNRANVQAYRARRAAGDNSGDVTGDNSGDDSAVPGGEARQGKDAVTEPKLDETSHTLTAAQTARSTGCYACQRAAGFNPDGPPCPDHRNAA